MQHFLLNYYFLTIKSYYSIKDISESDVISNYPYSVCSYLFVNVIDTLG